MVIYCYPSYKPLFLPHNIQRIMKHHEEAEEKSYDYLYYLIGLLSGLFTGLVIDTTFILIPILGIVGLLFAGFFLNVFVRGRGKA